MAFQKTLRVANPSPYERSDYLEIELDALKVPRELDEKSLCLYRIWPGNHAEEIPCQIDYPFGRKAGHRVLTFFSRQTPPSGSDDYSKTTAEFSLVEGVPSNFTASLRTDLLKIEHYTRPGEAETKWDPTKRIIGVKLCNGGELDGDRRHSVEDGLQVYFSLVPRPEQFSPVNYAGAATSVLHHRAWRHDSEAGEMLVAPVLDRDHAPEKRWGQLTGVEFYALPWERRWYHTESLLGQPGQEPEYTLAWSNTGPLRATVCLRSPLISVRYGGTPFFKPGEVILPCYLYRVISVYPKKEFYTEQLLINVEGEGFGISNERVSLAFRARYYSYVDYPTEVGPQPARLSEDIPDYFAVWRHFYPDRRGYAFACDSHVRTFKVSGQEITWRLQLGHDHRCVHLFPYHGFHGYPGHEQSFNPLQEVGHVAWYEWLYKPLQVVPLNRYVTQP